MLIKTEAICIKNTRFGESSVISKMFTLEYGLSSFILQGINKKSGSIRPSHILPGNILELVIYQKSNSNIQRIKELKVKHPLLEIHINMIKNSILQFIIEIIAKTNEEEFKDEQVFNFFKETILELETQQENLNYSPLLFLCKYLKYSGWFPNMESWETGAKFNLQEGNFVSKSQLIPSIYLIDELESLNLYHLLRSTKENQIIDLKIIKNKKTLFDLLIHYYEIHILKGKKIKSPSILGEIIA